MAVAPNQKKRFLLPDNSFLELPDEITSEDKQRISLDLARRFPDQYGSLLDPYQTLAGGTAEFFKGIPRGAASTLLGSAQGAIGLFTPGLDTEAEKSLREAQKYLETESVLAPEEVYRDEFATQLGSGLGSLATFALPGGAAKLAGAAATSLAPKIAGIGLATTSGVGEQAQRVAAAREEGKDISTGAETGALLAGLGIGASEMLPIDRLFRKVTPETGSALLNIFSRIDKRNPVVGSVTEDIMRLTGSALKQGAAEGLQEGLSGMAQNLVSKTFYDPDIVIGETFLDDLLVGGGVGAIADVLVDAMGGRRTVANKLYRDKEEQLRRRRIERYNAEQADALRTEREKQQTTTGVLMLPSPSTVTGGPASQTADGVYTVSLKGNADRFTNATVFSSPDGRGGVITMVYSPESEGYYDITGELAAGRNVEDAVAVAVSGDLGVAKPSKAVSPDVGFGAVRKALDVKKSQDVAPINPEAIQSMVQRGVFAPPSEDGFASIQPLPNGGYAIVDILRGVPISGEIYMDDDKSSGKEKAYSALRDINDQNAAISAANVINYLGLNGVSPAYRMAATVRSPQNRLIQRSVISAFLPKEARANLKPFFSPEEAKKMLGPKDFDDMMLQFGQVNQSNNLLSKYVKNPLEVDPSKRSVSSSALIRLGNDKNLKINIGDKAFKDYAKYWTGTENWGDMSNGQRMYLMTRIANTQRLPEQIKFPNLLPRQYKRSQFDAVLSELGAAKPDGSANALSLNDIKKITGLDDAQAKQIFQDLVASGRVKPVVPGKIQLIKSEAQYQADRKARLSGFPAEETAQEAAERMRKAGFSEESVAKVEKAGQQEAAPAAPTAKVQAEIDAREDAAVAAGADPAKERTAAKFDTILADALRRYGVAKFVKQQLLVDSLKTRKTPSGQVVTTIGWFDPLKKTIAVNIGDKINDPNISDEEIIRRIVETVDHEVIHAMREADLFTEKEWNTLSNFVRTAKIDKRFLEEKGDTSLMATRKGGSRVTTMLDDVRIRYAGKGLSESQLIEEAVAEAFRMWRKHGGKFAAGKPASLFQRMLNFINSFARAWRGSGATSIDQVFSSIESGEIGSRTPGLSIFNQDKDAVIRSLNESDKELSKVKKTIKKGGASRGPVKIGGQGQIGEASQQEQMTSALEIPISEADEKRVNDFLETKVGTAPFGYTSRFNSSAPKRAIVAAMDYEENGKETPFPDSGKKFLLNEIASEPIENDIIADNVERYGKIKADNYTLGQKAIMLIESLGNGGLKSAFDDFSRIFRKAVVDRYNEFRRQEDLLIGTENERYLMAETSASGALGQLDRARGWIASALQYGGIKWVKGSGMVTANPREFDDDAMAGYIDIDESSPGLLKIMEPLVNGMVPNGMGQFKTYSTLKRIQGFRNRAKAAQQRLDSLPPDASPALIKELKDTIAAQDKVRLVDNPSDKRISQLIEEVDAEYPQVKEAYEAYQKWNNTLITFGQDTGILTKDLADKWKEWGDYFPFYEELEDAVMKDHGFRTKSSMTKADFLTKALTERAKDLEDADPLDMITKNAFGIIQAGLKNVAAGRILRNSVLVDEARRLTSANPQREAAQLRGQGSYVKTVFENGNVVYYEVADPLLHESMMNYGDPTLNTMTKILAMPANALREMVTRDPGFILANMFRDTLSSFVTSGTGYVPVIDTFKQFATGDIQTLIKTGIVGGYDFSADPSDLQSYIKKAYRKMGINAKNHSISQPNAVTQLWDWMGDITTRSDAATRMAVYNAVLKETGSEATARQAAIEVINFSRRGSNPLWRVVTAAVPFLNARIQGLDVIYRTMAGKYSPHDGLEAREVTRKRALMRGASLAALTGVYFMLMQDNEEYKKARREVRDDNWLIPAPVMGDKVMLKLPIPFEIGMLFKATPEIFLNLMFGDMDARGLRESLVRQATNSLNFNITGFQIVKPLTDVIRNKNSFTGKDIVPYWINKGTEASQQFDEKTSLISKEIGEALNISPMKLDYVIGGYGGSLGLSLFLLTDKIIREAAGDKTAGTKADYTDINNVPLLRRFIYNAGKAGSLQEQEFYELRDESDKAYTTIRDIAKEGDVSKYYAYLHSRKSLIATRQEVLAIERYLQRMKDLKKEILKSDLPDEQKRLYLEQIEADKDLRLTGVPLLRERAEIPARAASAIFDVFIG